MSRLDQIQISFVAAEDRLMMRMSTNEDSEFRFWLTRWFVKALRPALEGTLGKQTRIQTQVTQSARKELLAFEHEKAVQSADFATPYKPHDKSLPLGEQPVLLSRFQIRPADDGSVVLNVGTGEGQRRRPVPEHEDDSFLDRPARPRAQNGRMGPRQRHAGAEHH